MSTVSRETLTNAVVDALKGERDHEIEPGVISLFDNTIHAADVADHLHATVVAPLVARIEELEHFIHRSAHPDEYIRKVYAAHEALARGKTRLFDRLIAEADALDAKRFQGGSDQ